MPACLGDLAVLILKLCVLLITESTGVSNFISLCPHAFTKAAPNIGLISAVLLGRIKSGPGVPLRSCLPGFFLLLHYSTRDPVREEYTS